MTVLRILILIIKIIFTSLHCFFSKARIALLDEFFTSRSELSSLIRILAKDIKAQSENLINVHILGDSTCVISAISQAATFFKLYMHFRMTVIHLTIDNIRKQAKAMPIQYILSKEKNTGIATRSETSLSMLGPILYTKLVLTGYLFLECNGLPLGCLLRKSFLIMNVKILLGFFYWQHRIPL